MIKVNNLSFSVNNKKLFHNLSFAISEGELIRISGSNGSGKTTLLKIMLGITPPKKGFVEKEFSFGEKEFEFLGHKNGLKTYLSVKDNLYLMDLKLNDKNLKVLNDLSLLDLMSETVGNLSYGQQKKLALARVILSKARLILLDEPFVGLDDDSKKLLEKFLYIHIKTGKSAVITSHIDIDLPYSEICLDD